jgi:hypothetical protein
MWADVGHPPKRTRRRTATVSTNARRAAVTKTDPKFQRDESKTKMRLGNRRLRSIGVLVVFVLVCAFAPGIYTAGWHLRHGSSIPFAGASLHVPLAWIGSGDYLEANLTKLQPTFIFGTWPAAGITLSKSRETPGRDESIAVQNWRDAQIALSNHAGKSSDIASHSRFTCMQRTIAQGKSVDVSCYAFPGTRAEFIGRKKDVMDFLEILSSVRR